MDDTTTTTAAYSHHQQRHIFRKGGWLIGLLGHAQRSALFDRFDPGIDLTQQFDAVA